MLALDTVPRHLVVVGGSYVGLEFAQMYRRFGAEVTVVEMSPRLVAREDEDVSEAVREILDAEGIDCRLKAECIRFAPRGDDIACRCLLQRGRRRRSQVLMSCSQSAGGRTPTISGSTRPALTSDERGFIKVDDGLATSAPGIWALGDCNGLGAFTHTAYNDFEIVAANLLDGANRRVSDRVPGYALYIDPPLGRVGMTETEARKAGRPLLVGKRPMTRVSRAVEKGETQGFMKVVADAETQEILGAAILGTGGDEAIHGILDAMNAGRALSNPAMGGADPSDRLRADPDHTGGDEADRLSPGERTVTLPARIPIRRTRRGISSVRCWQDCMRLMQLTSSQRPCHWAEKGQRLPNRPQRRLPPCLSSPCGRAFHLRLRQ